MIDTRPRRLTSRDVKLLQIIADELMSDVEGLQRTNDSTVPAVAWLLRRKLSDGRVQARDAFLGIMTVWMEL